jgi:IMP dehydrogenase
MSKFVREIPETMTYDDVLLVPQYSDIATRKEVDLGVGGFSDFTISLPVISSPMDTITEYEMCLQMAIAGGFGVIHRYNSVEDQVNIAHKCHAARIPFGAAVGVKDDYLNRATRLVEEAGTKILCVDVAHGHNKVVGQAISKLRTIFDDKVHIMAGNVATLEGIDFLADSGANSAKIGIGGGAICKTRIETGHGVPNLTAILECATTTRDILLIADGGLKTSGDIVKALAAGADAVMLGSMLAATDATPGDKIPVFDNGPVALPTYYKKYRGMASSEAQMKWRGYVSSDEGVSALVRFRGETAEVLQSIGNQLRSGLSYSGCRTITELHRKAKFIKQSHAGQIESSTHISAKAKEVK